MHSINGSLANKTVAEEQCTSDARFKAFLNNNELSDPLAITDSKMNAFFTVLLFLIKKIYLDRFYGNVKS